MKPEINEVLEIMAMKKQAQELYDEIDNQIAQIKDEFGAGRFDYDLDELQDGDLSDFADKLWSKGQYFKLEITDNAEKLQAGDTVFKSTFIKPVSFSSRSLKRCPESLK